MALAQVERVEIIASNLIKDELLIELQEAGFLELEEINSSLDLDPGQRPVVSFESLLFRLRQAIHYLSLWRKARPGEGWFKPRPIINRQEREAILSQNWDNLIGPIERLESSYRETKAEIKALEKEKEMLLPWQYLDLPLAGLESTASVEVLLVRLPRFCLSELIDLEKEQPLVINEISSDKRFAYLLLLVWRPVLKEIEEKLKELNVSFFFLPESILKKSSTGRNSKGYPFAPRG